MRPAATHFGEPSRLYHLIRSNRLFRGIALYIKCFFSPLYAAGHAFNACSLIFTLERPHGFLECARYLSAVIAAE